MIQFIPKNEILARPHKERGGRHDPAFALAVWLADELSKRGVKTTSPAKDGSSWCLEASVGYQALYVLLSPPQAPSREWKAEVVSDAVSDRLIKGKVMANTKATVEAAVHSALAEGPFSMVPRTMEP